MFLWKDPGKEFDEKLARMRREELEDELVSTMEFERIYNKYQVCVSELMKAKQNDSPCFPKKWIDNLNRPEIGAGFNDLHWDLVCRLKKELTAAVKMAGYTLEDDKSYLLPIDRNCVEANRTKLIKYLVYKNQKFVKGDFVEIKEYHKEPVKGLIFGMTGIELIPGIYLKIDANKTIQIDVGNIESIVLADR